VNQASEEKPTGSIAHATSILISISNDCHALTDIARECSLGKSTVHRVLKLLEQSQFVVQDGINRRYYLGPLVTRLTSNPVTNHEYLIMYANEEMKRLAKLSEETVTLDIMIGFQGFSLYEVPSQHDLKVSRENRVKGPLQAGASVNTLLSRLNAKQLKAAVDSMNITRITERTVTDKETLMMSIKEIKQQGYAVSRGEWLAGVICLSVPVSNYSVPVSLSVVGPEARLRQRENDVIKELKASAARISGNIKQIFEQ